MTGTSNFPELKRLEADVLAAIAAAADLAALDQVRVGALGKKGSISEQMGKLGSLPGDQRKAFGQATNEVKTAVTAALDLRQELLEDDLGGVDLAALQRARGTCGPDRDHTIAITDRLEAGDGAGAQIDRGLQLAGGRRQLGLDEQQVGAQATGRRQPLQGVRRRGMTARAARHVAARQGHAPGQQEAPGAGLAVATLQVLEALGREGQLGLGHGELVGAHSRRPGGTGRPFCIHSTTTMTAITSTAIAAPPRVHSSGPRDAGSTAKGPTLASRDSGGP